MDDSDSGDDIFITQNTYQTANDVDSGDSPPCTSTYIENMMLEEISDISSEDDILCTALEQAEAELVVSQPSTSTGEVSEKSRIGTIISDDQIRKRSVRSLSTNTEKKITWAVNLFTTWKRQRNRLYEFDASISHIHPDIQDMTKDELNFSVSRFVCEVKKMNGEDYPANTLYELVIQLQLFLEQKGKLYKLLSDDKFVQIRNTLDFIMKERTASGIGTTKRQAEVITEDEEAELWRRGILGMDSPRRLLDTLVYLLGLNFALRAGLEHRQLRWANPQLTLVSSGDGEEALRYAEDVSKANQGGLSSRRIKQKVVYAFPNKTNPERCLIRCFKTYVEKCPATEKRPKEAFYLRPLSTARGDTWFQACPVGINQLRGTVARICKEAGLKGLRTNHSLRATAATRLYQAGFEEQLVCEITGHKSEAVREYKRTDTEMKRKASEVISAAVQPEGMKRIRFDQATTPLNITVNVNMKAK